MLYTYPHPHLNHLHSQGFCRRCSGMASIERWIYKGTDGLESQRMGFLQIINKAIKKHSKIEKYKGISSRQKSNPM